MTDPMETLRAHGWRMRAPFCFVRRGECLWLGADGWWRWIAPGIGTLRACDSLEKTVEWMYGDTLSYWGIPDYAPIMEAVR